MRYLRAIAVIGAVVVAFAIVIVVYTNLGPLRQAPLAWAFAAAGALLTTVQALRMLRRPPRPPAPTITKYVVPQTLPPSPAVVGRDDDLREIMRRVTPRAGRPGVVVLHGEPGVGKTALAIDAARRLTGGYPDGTLFAWLGGRATAESVLRVFVARLQGPDERVPEDFDTLAARYEWLTGNLRRRLVIVLDDATDAQTVRALLPANDESAVIVTSRTELPIPGAAPPLEVKPLGSTDAIRVLASLVGQQRIERELAAAQRIAASAHGSPLALNLTGTSLAARPNWTLKATLDSAANQDTGTSLDLSVSLLTEQEKAALLMLGLLDDRMVEPWMLATLMQLPQERLAWRICDRLVHYRLLEHVVDDATGVATYRIPEHVLEYAKSRRDALGLDGGELIRARQRLDDQRRNRGQRDLSRLMYSDVYPELEHGNLSSALNNIRGALAQARDNLARASNAMRDAGLFETGGGQGPEVARYRLARDAEGLALAALAEVLAELGSLDQAMEMALAAKRTDAAAAQPRALRCIGSVQRRQRRLGEARATLLDALRGAERLKLKSEQVRIWRELALLHAEQGETGRAHDALNRASAIELSPESRDRIRKSMLWARSAVLLAEFALHRDPELAREAARTLSEAITFAGRGKQHLWDAWIGYQRAQAFRYLGRHEQARSIAGRAAADFAAMRHRYGAALCRFEQVRSYLEQDEAAAALPIMEDARQSLAYCEDRFLESQAVLTLAQLHIATQRVTERTGEELEAAARILHELGDDAGRRQARHLLSQAREMLRRLQSGQQGDPEPPIPGGFWTPAIPLTGGR